MMINGKYYKECRINSEQVCDGKSVCCSRSQFHEDYFKKKKPEAVVRIYFNHWLLEFIGESEIAIVLEPQNEAAYKLMSCSKLLVYQ